MKNKFFNIFIILSFSFFYQIILYANEINLEASKINTFNEGDIIIGKGNAKALINNRIELNADKLKYIKKSKILEAEGNVKVFDKIKQLELTSENLIYKESIELISAKNNVNVIERNDNIRIESNLINYFVLEGEFISEGKTTINIEGKYLLDTQNLNFNSNSKILSSNYKTKLIDFNDNVIEADNFSYSKLNEILKGQNFKINDSQKNKYFLKEGYIELLNQKMLGKDIKISLDRGTFGNNENDPRLIGNAIVYGEDKTIVNKGVFTTCKINKKNCPPWHIKSKEIIHDKKKQEIHYKNAWLNIYNTPVMYFPKFFHPDPSVKRRSGFLTPEITNNNNLGQSFKIPYFHVISDSSDLTFKPRLFSPNEFLLQNEFRKLTENSSHILDFSINKNKNDNKNGRKTHFFSNSKIYLTQNYFDESIIDLKIEKVSNDNYINEYGIESTSPIIKDTSTLESILEFGGSKNDFNIDVSIEAYETMNKSNNDRYEFVYPNYSLSKLVILNQPILESINFNSSGNQKKFSTNVYEGVQINDLLFSTNNFILKNGFNQNFKTLFKNINSEGINSSKYKDNFQSELLNISTYDISLPMIKYKENSKEYLIPKLSLRHSPNDTKNIKNSSTLLSSDNIFSLQRIGTNDNIEGGSSATIGLGYERKNNENNKIFESNIATIFREKEDTNLPKKSSLGKKQSDIVGELKIIPSEKFNIDYNYLLDKNINKVNLHNFSNTIKVNNFVNKFSFYEENNLVGKESFYENSFTYSFDENNLIKFSTRENKKDNLTEFYNLVYEYKNDCLTASIKYNKKYYSNSFSKPSEDLFFTLTIIPLGSTQTDSILE